jgi:hypothetical protein
MNFFGSINALSQLLTSTPTMEMVTFPFLLCAAAKILQKEGTYVVTESRGEMLCHKLGRVVMAVLPIAL